MTLQHRFALSGLLVAAAFGAARGAPVVTSVHPSTLASNTTNRALFAVRIEDAGPLALTTGSQVVFVVRCHSSAGMVTLSNPGPVVVTSDPSVGGLQGTWTSSVIATPGLSTDTLLLTYTAGATNTLNADDVVAVAADVTPSASPPNGGEYGFFVNGVVSNGTSNGARATLAFVGFPVGPAGPQGPPGPAGSQGIRGAPGVSVTGVAEPPGANCAAGGVAYTSVSGTDYVCNGLMGSAGEMGSAGPQGDPGPTGANGHNGGCSAGGGTGSLFAALAVLIACTTLGKRRRAVRWPPGAQPNERS
jgi:hypothetical protein